MRNTILIIVTLLVLGGFFYLLTSSDVDNELTNGTGDQADSVTRADSVVLNNDGEELAVLAADGEILYSYAIDAFNAWSSEFWDTTFTERPAFGEVREVEFENFTRFDQALSISPDGRYVAFVVSDYAVATTLSFVGILSIESETVELIRAVNNGGVSELVWSDDSQYIAYRLDTARAQGDTLAIASVVERERLFALDAEQVLSELGDTSTEWRDYMPEFSNLQWVESSMVTFDYVLPDGEVASGTVNPTGTSVNIE